MPALRIPPRYQPGIRAIASLEDEADVQQLVETLHQTPQRLATERLARVVEAAVPSLRHNAFEAVDALISLAALMDEDEDAATQLASDVANSEDLDLPEPDREELARRMAVLLQLRTLALAARAADLSGEHERVFHDARIITDIRPVFGATVGEGPRAAVLAAMLKIEWHSQGGGRPVEADFFALDHSDLIRLRDVVDRALDKIARLEVVLASMDLPYWEYGEVEESPDATDS